MTTSLTYLDWKCLCDSNTAEITVGCGIMFRSLLPIQYRTCLQFLCILHLLLFSLVKLFFYL